MRYYEIYRNEEQSRNRRSKSKADSSRNKRDKAAACVCICIYVYLCVSICITHGRYTAAAEIPDQLISSSPPVLPPLFLFLFLLFFFSLFFLSHASIHITKTHAVLIKGESRLALDAAQLPKLASFSFRSLGGPTGQTSRAKHRQPSFSSSRLIKIRIDEKFRSAMAALKSCSVSE